jgi:hypothetical protein
MPRVVSLTAMRSALAQNTGEVWVTLLKITHPDLPAPLYFCDNTEAVVHSGNSHAPAPFSCTLPSDESEREPTAALSIANVDRGLIDEVRSISSGPTIEVKVVLASSPNTVEYGPVTLKAKSVTYDARSITFTLGFDAFEVEPLPWVRFTPEFFPGMFR